MGKLTDILFHLDEWLREIAILHPNGAYALFLGIVFLESAFFPLAFFLPGDGLLFAVGVLSASGAVNVYLSAFILIAGGVLGNYIAYNLGQWLGPEIFDRFRWLNQDHYKKAHEFFRKYGNKALILSRFVPVIRALVPFVAGVAEMNKREFMKYNVISVCIWVLSIVSIAYFLGHIPFIQHHITWFIFGIAGLSIVPMVIGVIGARNKEESQ